MSDDTTEALNRIANALELQALVSAYRTYADDAEHYSRIASEIEGEELGGTFMEYANKNYSRADHVHRRIDQLTGYTEEEQ